MNKLSYKIDFKSLFRKSVPDIDLDFSINLINGYQGSGKTYYAVYHVENFFNNRIIYTNIKSFKPTNNKVIYFDKIEQIYNNTEKHCVFVIDELSKKYTKNSPIDKSFYSWLQQSRKHQRHVFMITQEYLQVPNWLRGIANTVYTTEKLRFFPLYKTSIGTPDLNKDSMEWEIDVYSWIIYKRTLDVAQKYDTFEAINYL